MSDLYRSDIPQAASEDVLERYPSGSARTSRFVVGEEVVGARSYYESGQVESETPRRNGLRHGVEYQWDEHGRLRSAIPYWRGLEHGTSRQWGPDGALMGSYEMRDGTGVDVWHDVADGRVYVSEIRHYRRGERHGVEWLVNPDQHSVHREMTYRDGVEHGILRDWEPDGTLSEGFPAYFVDGVQVSAAEYEARCAEDPTLPRYRPADDAPSRRLPAIDGPA